MAGAEFLEVSNPILAGCHPDPSICRVGDDYFLVTSTFEYFPGLPIYHSTDLAQWRLIGHAISEEGQLDYTGIRSSGGLYAPTIRHDGEKFWVVCTLVAHDGEHPGGNFVMTTPRLPARGLNRFGSTLTELIRQFSLTMTARCGCTERGLLHSRSGRSRPRPGCANMTRKRGPWWGRNMFCGVGPCGALSGRKRRTYTRSMARIIC